MEIVQSLNRVFFPLGLLITFFISTAGSCSSSTNQLPLISSVYTETNDITLDPVYLRYDMAKFISDCQRYGNTYPASDLQELYAYNNILESSSWLNFYSLFDKTDKYAGPGAEVKFIFSQPDCRGNIPVIYNKFDDKLCNHNTIANAPKINKAHIVEFSAHTIKTSQNGIQIKWSKSYIAAGQGTYFKIDFKGSVDSPSYLFSSVTKGGNQVAVRFNDNRFVFVENTISPDIPEGDYALTIIEDAPVISNTLKQNICINGAVNTTKKWDIPVIAELEIL